MQEEKFTTKESVILFLIPIIGMMLYACNYHEEKAKQALDISIAGLIIYTALYCFIILGLI